MASESDICVDYLSTGANRHTAAADWNDQGILVFGADTNIALWKPDSDDQIGIKTLLSGHDKTVKAVKFLGHPSGQTGSCLLLSGSDDQTLKVWHIHADLRGELLQSVHEHTAPINCIAVLTSRNPSSPVIVASGAADATVKIWSFGSERLELLQTIRLLPKFFPLGLALSSLDGDDGGDDDVVVLAVAGTKDIIQVFVAHVRSSPPLFTLQATLTGHEGWIRSLDFTWETKDAGSDLILASASQDKYVRLWRFHEGSDLPAMASNSDPSSGAFLPGKSPSNRAHKLRCAEKEYSITFEALLLGHEDWIYSARWFSHHPDGKLQLLSTSADNSLSVWEPDTASGIWITTVRLGEISRDKGGTTATGSIGGFWTGLWGPGGQSLACLGRTGSWRRWVFDAESDQWQPAVAVSGHTKAVTGIAWSSDGSYLLSTGLDQTTRLHAPWKSSHGGGWHEMARPQIHGYDLNCIDTLGDSQFVSGADEKLMRVFSKPRAVAKLLSKLSGGTTQRNGVVDDIPDAANMPVLGLSNKAVDAVVDDDVEIQPADHRDRDSVDPASVVRKSALEIDHPPLEESLSRHTLWPEIEKLYGHGYEISCLAASHDGKLIASACKASSLNHAVIRIFETEKWTEIKPPLTAHNLTATRIRFSHDDRYLLSVGRDRQWAVFERSPDSPSSQYQLCQANPKGHSRMILDAAWAPSNTPRVFATAGRDKRVRIWWSSGQQEESQDHGKIQFVQVGDISLEGPVTAVDFLPRVTSAGLVLAVGTESGNIFLYNLALETLQVSLLLGLPEELRLPKPVLQLAWRPSSGANDHPSSTEYQLAVAGDDSSLRIYRFPSIAPGTTSDA